MRLVQSSYAALLGPSRGLSLCARGAFGPRTKRSELRLNLPENHIKPKPDDPRKSVPKQKAPILKLPEEIVSLTQEERDSLPYLVRRRNPKYFYISLRLDRPKSRTTTILSNAIGDCEALAEHLSEIIPRERISFRPMSGRLLINGNYKDILALWLALRGF